MRTVPRFFRSIFRNPKNNRFRRPVAVTAMVLAAVAAALVTPATVTGNEEINPFNATLPADPPYDINQAIRIAAPAESSMVHGATVPQIEIYFRDVDFGLVPQSLELWIDGAEHTESLDFWQGRAWLQMDSIPTGQHTLTAKILDGFGGLHQHSTTFGWQAPPPPTYPWPFDPTGEPNVVSNLMEDWQSFGGDPYWHSGIDIRVDAGTPVKACRGGEVVKVVNYIIQGVTDPDLYWEVAIKDADDYIWQYHHIEPNSITVSEGNTVNQGDVLGEIVTWPSFTNGSRYNHLHLNVVKYTGGGAIPDPYEEGFSYYNPLRFLTMGTYDDVIAPESFDIWFGLNNSNVATSAASDPTMPELSADVDIFTQLRDWMTTIPGIGGQPFNLGLYEIAYKIRPRNLSCPYGFLPRTTLYRFDDIPFPGANIATQQDYRRAIYKPMLLINGMWEETYFDNTKQCFFYVPTNTFFGVPVTSEGKWDTDGVHPQYGTSFPDGQYVVTVYATDFYGNETATSVDVIVDNDQGPPSGCPYAITNLVPSGDMELDFSAGGNTSVPMPTIPLSFGDIIDGSAKTTVDHLSWPVMSFEVPTMGVCLEIGLLAGAEAEVEYVPYLGDVILEIPAEAQVHPIGGSFDPNLPSTNPVTLRISTRLARDPWDGASRLGAPILPFSGTGTLVLAEEVDVLGEIMPLHTEDGGVPFTWGVSGPSSADVKPRVPGGGLFARVYPNPFGSRATIEFTLPEPSPVSARIFDVSGRLVRSLETENTRNAGTHTLGWDGTDDRGRAAGSGVYFYRIDYREGDRAFADSGRLVLKR